MPDKDAARPHPEREDALAAARYRGGLTYDLARVFKIINSRLRNPQTADWEQAFGVSGLLL